MVLLDSFRACPEATWRAMVRAAATGERTSRELAAALQPDLLIIDFPYRERPAWDLIEQLDATPATRIMPIIATSTDPDNLAQFAARPMVRTSAEVLLKPFDLDPLVDQVTALVPVRS